MEKLQSLRKKPVKRSLVYRQICQVETPRLGLVPSGSEWLLSLSMCEALIQAPSALYSRGNFEKDKAYLLLGHLKSQEEGSNEC